MFRFILGMIFGIVVATVGINGVARILNHGVESIQTHTQELAK